MTKSFIIQGVQNYEHASAAETLSYLAPRQRQDSPVSLWPGQDFTPLYRGYNIAAADPVEAFRQLPSLSLNLYTFENAYFVVDNGLDGVILTADKKIIQDPSCFRAPHLTQSGQNLMDDGLDLFDLDDVFVGFDAALHNYFHILCFMIGKYAVALKYLPKSCKMVIPDLEGRTKSGYSRMAYRNASYQQALAISGLAGSVTRLPVGIYRAKKLRFLWTQPNGPMDLLDIPDFYSAFMKMRGALKRRAGLPRRLLVWRDQSIDPRLTPKDSEMIRTVCQQHGFELVRFETMDLLGQAEAVYNADAIVSPHGAGLANLLFGREELRVLELNYEIDNNESLRACFYQIAAGVGQKYMVLNGSRGEINHRSLSDAMDILCR